MNIQGAIAGGLAGGLLGSLVWIGVGYASGYELGILAILVGIGCGMGVAMGTKGRAGTAGGIIAALCAMLAIVAARYVLVQISINQLIAEASGEVGDMLDSGNGEFWTAFIADRIIDQRVEVGEDIAWPDEDLTYDTESLADDYDPAIWAEATAKWNAMSDVEREEFCAAGAKSILLGNEEDMESARTVFSIIGVLIANFHPMALVFMGLSMASAFKIARDSRPVAEVRAEGDDFVGINGGNGILAANASEPADGPIGLPGMPAAGPMARTAPPAAPPTVSPPSAAPTRSMPPNATLRNAPSSTFTPPSDSAPTGLPGMPPPSQAGTRKFYSS